MDMPSEVLMPPLPLTDFPMWHFMFSALALTWGTCIGSFLNACIYRIPNELSVVHPRSFCPICRMKVAWYDNIPVFSWMNLRGRCRSCRTFISPRYLLVECLVGVLFFLAWLKFDLVDGTRPLGLVAVCDWQLVPVYWLVISGLVLGTFVDFEHLIIPDRVTLGGIAAGLTISIMVPQLHNAAGPVTGLLWSAVGAVSGWGLLWGVAVMGRLMFKKEAMGFGDVKLLGAIGAFLGWRAVLFTIVISSLLGSIVGITLVLIRARRLQSKIPYGPYIALAAVLWIYWGPVVWQAYMGLMRPAGL
ncbi:MAG: prepilin peptidase [Kiritimatiellia bacterium]|nr:prepilin peptidase [Kiritimatiellia bacterium]